jgi:acyl-CoA synthetase (NDP forming)
MTLSRTADLNCLFEPRAVAVIGASGSPGKTGHTILKNIIDGGFPGAVYPVNPRGGEILGRPVVASVSELPGPGRVDLAVVVIPAAAVPGALFELAERGVKAAIIISGGFREAGNDALEAELTAAIAKTGLRVIGPNCQGIVATGARLCASWPLTTRKGPIAVISQSGTVAAAVAGWAEGEGFGVSGVVSLGNRADLDEADLIAYFSRDPGTSAVALYVEGLADGRRFMAAARALRRAGKALFVLRPGRTARGVKAAQSHTKSMAGSYQVFVGVARQVGAVAVPDLDALFDTAKTWSYLRGHSRPGLAVVTSSGGSAILAADTAEEAGYPLADLAAATMADLKAALPPHCVIGNPLDLTGDADAPRLETAARLLLATPEVGVVLAIFGDPIPGAAETMARLRGEAEAAGKQIVCCYVGGGETEKSEVELMWAQGLLVFPTPERAARALALVCRQGRGSHPHGKETGNDDASRTTSR